MSPLPKVGRITCPYCDSEDTRKTGMIITTKGKKQRHQCKKCGKTFHEKDKGKVE